LSTAASSRLSTIFNLRFEQTQGITMHGMCCNILSGVWGLKYTRYGLGTCYLRMNKVRLAEYHYRKAAEIHPNNAILIGCIGLVRTRFFLSPGSATTIFRQKSGPGITKQQFNYTQKQSNCVLRTPLYVTVEGSC
jgi:hypothetical protein